MMLRSVLRECRDFPATTAICLIWIAVFAAMAACQFTDAGSIPWTGWLLSGISAGHRFGDLTLLEVRHGQLWRLVTCTFVHYSLLHIGLNLIAMYQLGTLVESWYGSPQFVFIYGVIAGFGNLIAVLVRSWNGWGVRVHSGGGSVVILGLVGLCAVVGWRLRAQMGPLLYRQMIGVLITTALIGIALPRYIDNWGHAGGAIVGSVLGFGHGAFLRGVSKPRAWGAGILTGLAIALCGAAQVIADRIEAPARQEAGAIRRVADLERAARGLDLATRLAAGEGDVRQIRTVLALVETNLDHSAQANVRRLRGMVEEPPATTLSKMQRQQLQQRLAEVAEHVRRLYRAERRRLAELRRAPGYRRGVAR
jgi:membrane associated rhomboid family serine protease